MIGFILYEFFEMLFYISKLGYNGVSNIYNWYYKNKNDLTNDDIKNKIIELKKHIIELENSIK